LLSSMLFNRLFLLFVFFVNRRIWASVFLLCACFLFCPQSTLGAERVRVSNLPTEKDMPLVLDKNIPQLFQMLVHKDLAVLQKVKVKATHPSTKNVFESDLTNVALQKWLYDRSRFILSEQFVITPLSTPIFRNFHSYMNPIIPQFEIGKNDSTPVTVRTVMSNIGAKVYYSGKTQKALFQIIVPGHGAVPVTTPRVGIFKIGSALFDPLIPNLKSGGLASVANSLARLKTYFHEARHSDGNGSSLVFAHAVCPEGHDYAGYNACDKNLNGPYSVGALFLSATINSCSDCSKAEKEALRVLQADSFSRVIRSFKRERAVPSSVVIDSRDETCNQLRKMKVETGRYTFCSGAAQSRVKIVQEQVNSVFWDPNPETAGPLE
jgi:hypothetical protein